MPFNLHDKDFDAWRCLVFGFSEHSLMGGPLGTESLQFIADMERHNKLPWPEFSKVLASWSEKTKAQLGSNLEEVFRTWCRMQIAHLLPPPLGQLYQNKIRALQHEGVFYDSITFSLCPFHD